VRLWLEKPARFSSGFTLVELMVSMTLGLGLMALMVGTIDNVLRASRVSAEAAETTERGYFLMDAIATWLVDTSAISSAGVSDRSVDNSVDPSIESSIEGSVTRLSTQTVAYRDLCDTPELAVLPPGSAGIALLDPEAWPCIPQRNLDRSSAALLIERRLPCQDNCRGAGFYAFPEHCFARGGGERSETNGLGGLDSDRAEFVRVEVGDDLLGASESEEEELPHHRIAWLDADRDRPSCFSVGTAFKVARSLIYVRDYAWRTGDGTNAIMLLELAQEPEARWLRASMLAYGIDAWQIACVFECYEVGDGVGALLAAAIDLRFTVHGRSQSFRIHRVLSPQRSVGLNEK